ncbi:MAG: hypothetical protein ACRDDF_11255 [Aeromonas sp.]
MTESRSFVKGYFLPKSSSNISEIKNPEQELYRFGLKVRNINPSSNFESETKSCLYCCDFLFVSFFKKCTFDDSLYQKIYRVEFLRFFIKSILYIVTRERKKNTNVLIFYSEDMLLYFDKLDNTSDEDLKSDFLTSLFKSIIKNLDIIFLEGKRNTEDIMASILSKANDALDNDQF